MILPGVRTLVVVSHVTHYEHEGRLFAYGPYSREIDVWAELFESLVVAAPLRRETPPGDCLPFLGPNIRVERQAEIGGLGLAAKIQLLVALPGVVRSLARAMRKADAIHVRCPGNLGLLGVVLAPMYADRLVAKYAGQWSGYSGEPWSCRLQRYLLAKHWKGPVTVYGTWPEQPPHVIPFFTSILSGEQVARAGLVAVRREPRARLEVLFSGRLSRDKNVHVLISAVDEVSRKGVPIRLTVMGDGPERGALERAARCLGPSDLVRFTGALPFERVLLEYEGADVLVLASESEGWPKAITEGMAFGLVCIGSNRGVIPELLGEGRGIVVPPGDVPAIASALSDLARRPDSRREIGLRASQWARNYSLDGLRDALRGLLVKEWKLRE